MASLQHLRAAPDLVEQAYTTLLAAISSGEFAPGHRLTQEELAETLAVSRQPVLQALRLLKQEGLVVDAPAKSGVPGASRGLMVAPLDADMIARLYEVRAVLDGLAARLAAQEHASIEPRLLAVGRGVAAGSDVAAMIDADLAFHNAIYAASGNPYIAESAGRHWQHIRRAMGAVLGAAGARAAVWDEHAAIVAAIGAGDVDQAERLARKHAAQAGLNLQKRLRAANEDVPAADPRQPSTTGALT
ncbi:MAG: GntR family transcriptional regulator [Burkholderiales bacterium]|nr:GntR family transcriptional regulator [Burkholderiales bacterium]